MYGTFETHIVGRIANKDGITLRKDEAGKPYCYVRVAVPRRPKANASGEKEEREPIWVDLAVGGTTATYLAQNAKSGMWLKCDAVGIPRTRTEEKNGTKVVYNDLSFHVVAGRCDLMGYLSMKKPEEEASAPASAPMSTAPASPLADIDQPIIPADAEMSATERRVTDSLPF